MSFIWFYRYNYSNGPNSVPENIKNDNKIGISPDRKFLEHDNILYTMKFMGRKKRNELVDYGNVVGLVESVIIYDFYQIGCNTVVSSTSLPTLLYYRYIPDKPESNNYKFDYIGFQGIEYKPK